MTNIRAGGNRVQPTKKPTAIRKLVTEDAC